jgi:hypothetical protein
MKDEEDEGIRKVFARFEKLLFKAANSVKSETVYGYQKSFSKKVDAAVKDFKATAKEYVDDAIPSPEMKKSSWEQIQEAGAIHETANVKLTTYVQIVTSLAGAANGFKDGINDYIEQFEKENGEPPVIADLRAHIEEKLNEGGVFAVEYGGNRMMPSDKYAAMLARTARIETDNIAMLGKALDDGNDLVECSVEPSTCPLCAVYQGRIYSISGKTPGYPALYKTAFKNGYSIIHPNCRHQFFPYDPDFHTPKEREELEAKTRQPFDEEKMDARFRQSKEAAERYSHSQTQMRQWNKELNEYADYRRQGGDNYKTIGGFRRAYRSEEGTVAYAKSHYWRRDQKQFEHWKSIVGAENMPKTVADFQKMKYNKEDDSFYLLQELKDYINENPKASKQDFETVKKLEENGVKGVIHIPPVIEDVSGFEFREEHINTERGHNVTREEAESYIQGAIVSVTKWKGEMVQYFSQYGATYINMRTGKIETSFKSSEYDEKTKNIIKEVLENGKR